MKIFVDLKMFCLDLYKDGDGGNHLLMITQPFCPFSDIRVFIFGFLPGEEKRK
jgi:hypothetical protein